MPANNNETTFVQATCPKCGEPKNALRNGIEVRVRCTCDWERGYHDRIRHTVMPTFYEEGRKKITDWSPPIFKKGVPEKILPFIRTQKALVMQKIYGFCFQKHGDTIYALHESIAHNRNLYIRGPLNSGRDLLLATVKIFAAAKDISTTPIPHEWATFKQDVAQADWNGKEADVAKSRIADYYRAVKILTLANVQSEGHWGAGDDKRPRRFRSSMLVDDILTRRMISPGSMVLTSAEFVGQLGDSLGDRLPDILTSPKTTLIIMLSVLEASKLVDSLDRKLTLLRGQADKAMETKPTEKKRHQDEISEAKLLEHVKDCLYLEHATCRNAEPGKSLTILLDMSAEEFPPKVNEVFAEFNANKEADNVAFREGIKHAKISIVKECADLGNKMTTREMEEVGEMLSVSCSGEEAVTAIYAEAVHLRQRMVSE